MFVEFPAWAPVLFERPPELLSVAAIEDFAPAIEPELTATQRAIVDGVRLQCIADEVTLTNGKVVRDVYLPSADEIRKACSEIQAEWKPQDFERRRVGRRRGEWNVPVVKTAERM